MSQFQPPQQPMPPGVYYQQRPTKDRTLAMILEILPALFGFFGFGWIYSGNTSVGLMWLIGVLIWSCIGAVASVLTGGLALVCLCPVNLGLLALSSFSLYNYTKAHPELFGV